MCHGRVECAPQSDHVMTTTSSSTTTITKPIKLVAPKEKRDKFLDHPRTLDPRGFTKSARNSQTKWKNIYDNILTYMSAEEQQLLPWNRNSWRGLNTKNALRVLYMELRKKEELGIAVIDDKPTKYSEKGFYGITSIVIVNMDEFQSIGYFKYPHKLECKNEQKRLKAQWDLAGFRGYETPQGVVLLHLEDRRQYILGRNNTPVTQRP